jgi:peptide/nickel transport system substrate-binding protein
MRFAAVFLRTPSYLVILLTWLATPSFSQSRQWDDTDFLQSKNLTGVRGGNLTAAVSSDPSTFNRLFASGLSNASIADRLSADLVHVNRNTLQLEPSLATRWEVDKSGRVYTIHLRHGLRFSDNSPFNADDVLFTFQVLTDPKVGCAMAGQIEIDGKFPSLAKIDDHTVQLAFPRPVGMGLRMLDSIPMLPHKNLLKAYQEGRLAQAWGPTVNPVDVVGLGPFRLKEYQRGTRIILERNPFYWKKDKSGQTLPYLDSVAILIIPDLNAQALRFGQGELDLMNSLNPENYATLRRTAANCTLRDLGPGLTMDYLWFNLNRLTRSGKNAAKSFVDPEKQAVFEKSDFRRAISHALDRKGMIGSIFLGLGAPQYGPLSTGNKAWFHTGIPKTDYNPARARELLMKAGLADSNGDGIFEYGSKRQPFEINILTSRGNSTLEKLAQVIQDNLLKIGIRVGIQHLLQNEIASRFMDSFEYEAVLFPFTPTDIAPDTITDLWYSSGKLHFWCPNQAKPERAWESALDSLISSFVRESSPAKRETDLNRVQDLWAAEMPAIPTIAPNILVGWSNKLENVLPSILTPHLLWNAEEICRRSR